MSAPVLSTEPEYAQVKAKTKSIHSEHEVNQIFSVDLICNTIREHSYTRPCLQFSDDLVVDASKVAQLIEAKSSIKPFVLADTSYSPCCVDEIAAQHIQADVLFHLGNACLNPGNNIPVYNVMYKLDIDLDLLVKRIGDRQAVIYADTDYTFCLDALRQRGYVVAYPSHGEFIPPLQQLSSDAVASQEQSDGTIPNRTLSKDVSPSEYELIYLSGNPSDSMTLYFATQFAGITVVDVTDPQLPVSESRPMLRKRYRLVEMAKSAATVGILVNTLSLKYMRDLLEVVQKWVKDADKKAYTFTVGKPNVAKLANFEVVDVWVILGCPLGGIIVDSSDYVKPIVTPYELKMALCFDWNGKWIIDLKNTLELDGEYSTREYDDEPHFDVVTGRLVNNAPLRQRGTHDEGANQLVESTNALTVKGTTSTAAQYLHGRQWQGLGSDHHEIGEFAELKMGKSGIARDYDNK